MLKPFIVRIRSESMCVIGPFRDAAHRKAWSDRQVDDHGNPNWKDVELDEETVTFEDSHVIVPVIDPERVNDDFLWGE